MNEEQHQVHVTSENCSSRVEEAMDTILACWSDWDGEASQDAQREQSNDAWFFTMRGNLRCVLEGMILDP